jgi:rhodanese-related sulfurtransferase
MFERKCAEVMVLCLLILPLSMAQESESRVPALGICSPVITLSIDMSVTTFGKIFEQMNSRSSLSQSIGPSKMSSVVSSISSGFFRFIGLSQTLIQGVAVRDIMPEDLYGRIQAGEEMILIDVRLPAEYEQSHIDGARNVPLDQVVDFLKSDEIPHDKAMVFICKTGGRSYIASMAALAHGYSDVYNLKYGMELGWLKEGLPAIIGQT